MMMRLNHCMLDHAITFVIMMQNTVDHEIFIVSVSQENIQYKQMCKGCQPRKLNTVKFSEMKCF